MEPTGKKTLQLADELNAQASRLKDGEAWWIGLAGAPGSGKTTLAATLHEELHDILLVIPMDGYHLTRQQLDGMDDPATAHARRGAPFTFDANRLVADLVAARRTGQGTFPGFEHGVGDPVEHAIHLRHGMTSLVLVEGNYLLLDDEPWSQLRTLVFDETWFLDVPCETCRERVLRRHIATGKTVQEAQQRVDNNDGPNAELVNRVSPANADRIISPC